MITIDCPSGFQFEARPFTPGDISRISRGNGEQMITGLLQACHQRTIEPGANAFIRDDGKPPWRSMCWADLIYATIEIRRGSFPEPRSAMGLVDVNNPNDKRPMGDILDFDFICRMPDCRKLVQWSIDLAEYIERCTIRINDYAADRLGRGQPLEHRMRDGKIVYWMPSTPERDEALRKYMQQRHIAKEGPLEVVAKHIVKVDDLLDGKGNPKREIRQFCAWLEELKSPLDFSLLNAAIETQQPTFDNELIVVCHHCNAEQKITIPLVHPAFLDPAQSTQAIAAIRAMTERERNATMSAENGPR